MKIVIEIVTEIDMEQIRLFQWNRPHYADFAIEIVIDFFCIFQCSFWIILTEIDKNQLENEHGYFDVKDFTVQKIGRAQADFFSGSDLN